MVHLRIWRAERIRCVQNFFGVVGDKLVTELAEYDGLAYVRWWRERVVTANKDIGPLTPAESTPAQGVRQAEV